MAKTATSLNSQSQAKGSSRPKVILDLIPTLIGVFTVFFILTNELKGVLGTVLVSTLAVLVMSILSLRNHWSKWRIINWIWIGVSGIYLLWLISAVGLNAFSYYLFRS
jgi:FtsH-binding integral membrane protein